MPREFAFDFVPDLGELSPLRDRTRATLGRWGLDALATVACLLVTELATNAIVHTQQPARLRLVHNKMLRIAVADGDSTPPIPRQPSIHDTSGGRGLSVVSGLAGHWNCTYSGDGGKTVWCEVSPHRAQ